MTELFSTISEFLPKANGWCTELKAHTLAALVIATRPKLALEVGSYAGKSSIPMALAMKQLGMGTLLAIDPYDPDESAKNETPESAAWWKKLEHNSILAEFEGYINSFGLQNIVQVKRMTSDAFDPTECEIDILHIDGAHSHALEDSRRYCPYVRQGGFVVMDDLNWYVSTRHTVKEATDWMEREGGFLNLYSVTKQSGIPNVPDDDWGVWQRL